MSKAIVECDTNAGYRGVANSSNILVFPKNPLDQFLRLNFLMNKHTFAKDIHKNNVYFCDFTLLTMSSYSEIKLGISKIRL